MTEESHPGFPPKYWEMLGKAAQEMGKEEACSACMSLWRTHGPAHYLAIRNVERCTDCAVRAALPVERAVLDWQYDHDPLKAVVKKVVDAYRKVSKEGAEETSKQIEQMREFWAAVDELNAIIPKEF